MNNKDKQKNNLLLAHGKLANMPGPISSAQAKAIQAVKVLLINVLELMR